MSSGNEFLESFEGRKYQFWSRSVNNTIIISFEVEKFQTKRSKSKDENLKFQNHILNKLIAQKRRCFRGNVAIQFSFRISQKNPPAIQSLLKHYIDLIQKPDKGVNSKREYLLIKDDSQIKALSAHYWKVKKTRKQKLSITIIPFRDFLYNLEFVKDMQMGKFSEHRIDYLYEDEDKKYEESQDRLNDLNAEGSEIYEGFKGIQIEIRGKKMDLYQYWKQMHNEQRNQELLKLSSNLSASALLALIVEPGKTNENNLKFNMSLNSTGRATTLNGWYNIDFGAVPVNKGDSKKFKTEVNHKIQEWKNKRGKQLPRIPGILLKFFYEKPEKVNHDLDNLLKYVLPHFDELINKDRYFKHVESIEIYQIQTISKNKKSGNLYLRIEDADNNSMLYTPHRKLEKHE